MPLEQRVVAGAPRSATSPQQYSVPFVVRPQVWSPEAITVANLSPPDTATGDHAHGVLPVMMPVQPCVVCPPTCPEAFDPQQ